MKSKASANELNIKFTLMFYNECCQASPKATGLRSPKNRSLLEVNEDFEGKYNAGIRLLIIILSKLYVHR